MYQWNDGRVFKGYWQNGKQHGLGQFKKPDSDEFKFGLWEEGTRI